MSSKGGTTPGVRAGTSSRMRFIRPKANRGKGLAPYPRRGSPSADVRLTGMVSPRAAGFNSLPGDASQRTDERHGEMTILDKLSPREAEIAKLMAQGKTAMAIADLLVISWHTVKVHQNRVYSKLGISKLPPRDYNKSAYLSHVLHSAGAMQ
jgi:DNA-binding CsgD family transcriptional regulator